ncbi:MNIO family bufferin maturase [Paraliomyxa miuraensis]|uniref:MNIO family bufferin maturase n=1 Tax=Paraliomyxa miuraensis TaxID=376150 RepID=UPI0022593BA0|nr:DUF692 domain-containing protein [Paraliomyxa miuraensis]MCX4240469.1 DUF692 domain-containing protein [Paraliomyxa miuraensis]
MRSPALAGLPRLGLGVGLRNVHFGEILERWPAIDWFEAISENFLDSGGRPRHVIRRIAERYPVVLHGVSLSIGSTDPLRRPYLARLRALADELDARWVSDHLCWTGIGGHNSHDLLPLPLHEDTLAHVAARVRVVQDILERPLVLENPSTYVSFAGSSMHEAEFLRALCDETHCGLLLDVNNVYVSCFNAGTDPWDYLERVPWERVVQLHLAGHQHCETHIVDTHDRPVSPEVWPLFAHAWQRSEGAATLLEWDGQVPALDRVHAEVLRAREHIDDARPPMPAPSVLAEPEAERPSTPVDFLVPAVMAGVRLHEQREEVG